VAAGDGCVFPAFHILHVFGRGRGVAGALPAVRAQRVHHGNIRQHVLARIDDLQVAAKVPLGLQTSDLPVRLRADELICVT
jgi:hypothetical protein